MRGNIMNDIVITNNEYIAGKIRLKTKIQEGIERTRILIENIAII